PATIGRVAGVQPGSFPISFPRQSIERRHGEQNERFPLGDYGTQGEKALLLRRRERDLPLIKEDPLEMVAGDQRSPLIVGGRKETLQGLSPLRLIWYPINRMAPTYDVASSERRHHVACAGVGQHYVLGGDRSQNLLDRRPRGRFGSDDLDERPAVVDGEHSSHEQRISRNEPRSPCGQAAFPRRHGGRERDKDEYDDVRDYPSEAVRAGDGAEGVNSAEEGDEQTQGARAAPGESPRQDREGKECRPDLRRDPLVKAGAISVELAGGRDEEAQHREVRPSHRRRHAGHDGSE